MVCDYCGVIISYYNAGVVKISQHVNTTCIYAYLFIADTASAPEFRWKCHILIVVCYCGQINIWSLHGVGALGVPFVHYVHC